jgi:hypothetical protein
MEPKFDPFPISPSLPYPQQETLPLAAAAQLNASPALLAAIETKPLTSATLTGVAESAETVPSPSWPATFLPQHWPAPLVSVTQV